MAKPNITTRATKGSALTWTEGDQNLENLRDATISIKADTAGTSVVSDLNGEITLVAGTNVTLTGDNTAKTITIDAAGGSGIDLTDLSGGAGIDYNNSTGVIKLTSSGLPTQYTGNVTSIDGDAGDWIYVPSVSAGFMMSYQIQFQGAGLMGTNIMMGMSYWIKDVDYANNRFTISDTMGGSVKDLNSATGLTDVTYQISMGGGGGTSTYKLQYNSSMNSVSWVGESTAPMTQSLSGLSDVSVFPPITDGYVLTYDSSLGKWQAEAPPTPASTDNITEGSTNLYFTTDRARSSISAGTGISYDNSTGVITSTVTSGISSVSSDTSPALGGDLNVNSKAIVSTSNGNIRIEPNGSGNIMITPNTGQIILGSTNYPTSTPSSGQILTAGSGGQLTWSTPSGGSGTVTSVSGTGTVNGLSLTGTVTDSGSLTLSGTLDLSSPPAIGETTANSGTFSAVNVKSQGNLNLYDSSNTFKTSLTASSTNSQNLTFTLPSTYGANTQILSTNGAGALTWADRGISVTTTTTNANYNIMTTSITSNTSGVTTSYIDSTSSKFAYNPSSGVLTVPALNFKYVTEPAYTLAYSATLTPNAANGSVQKVTLTGNVTISAFTSPVAGQSITLILVQDATGSRTLTSTMKFAGGTKTLSTAANSIDIITVYYDGTNYYASLAKGFA